MPPPHTMCRSGSEMRTIIDANRTLTLFTSFQVGIVSQGSGGDCANLNHPGKLEQVSEEFIADVYQEFIQELRIIWTGSRNMPLMENVNQKSAEHDLLMFV